MRTTIIVREGSNHVPTKLINSGEQGSFTWDFGAVMDSGDSILSAIISPSAPDVSVEISNITNQATTVSATIISTVPVGGSALIQLQVRTVAGLGLETSVWITTEFL